MAKTSDRLKRDLLSKVAIILFAYVIAFVAYALYVEVYYGGEIPSLYTPIYVLWYFAVPFVLISYKWYFGLACVALISLTSIFAARLKGKVLLLSFTILFLVWLIIGTISAPLVVS